MKCAVTSKILMENEFKEISLMNVKIHERSNEVQVNIFKYKINENVTILGDVIDNEGNASSKKICGTWRFDRGWFIIYGEQVSQDMLLNQAEGHYKWHGNRFINACAVTSYNKHIH